MDNVVLLERENGDWAYTIMRVWLYDQADAVRLAALAALLEEMTSVWRSDPEARW